MYLDETVIYSFFFFNTDGEGKKKNKLKGKITISSRGNALSSMC